MAELIEALRQALLRAERRKRRGEAGEAAKANGSYCAHEVVIGRDMVVHENGGFSAED